MTVINILFDDNQLRGLKHNFNEHTAEVVEKAMAVQQSHQPHHPHSPATAPP